MRSNDNMCRVLITGASGFAGRALVAALAQQSHSVRAASRRAQPSVFPPGVEIAAHGDFTADVDWRPLLRGIDKVVHLAGIGHTGRGIAATAYDRVNHLATAAFAGAAAQAGVRQFVFVSSVRAQCGATADHAVTERDPPAPTDAYGRSKLAAEQALRTARVPFTILRPALLYGPGGKGNFALLVRAAASRWPLPLKGFGNRRSLLGVDNLISAITFVLQSEAALGETFVVADPGIPPPLADVVATLRQAQGRRKLLLPMPPHYVGFLLRLIGRHDLWQRIGGNLRVDPSKLIAAGWHPRHDTRAGLTALAKVQPTSGRLADS